MLLWAHTQGEMILREVLVLWKLNLYEHIVRSFSVMPTNVMSMYINNVCFSLFSSFLCSTLLWLDHLICSKEISFFLQQRYQSLVNITFNKWIPVISFPMKFFTLFSNHYEHIHFSTDYFTTTYRKNFFKRRNKKEFPVWDIPYYVIHKPIP